MPSGSTVEITFDGVDITNKVLWPSARFESQIYAAAGTFEFTVKDVGHTELFTTGKIVELTIDGTLMMGGYALQIQRTYPFPAMDTTAPTTVPRYWTVRGADFNILFDKRVLHRSANYTSQIPDFTGDKMDGFLIRKMCTDYLNIPGSFDTSTEVDDIRPPFRGTPDASKVGSWNQQGDTWRQQMEAFTQFTGAIWYLSADRYLHHHAIEDTEMRWGFSDDPNDGSVTASPQSFQGATIGPREIVATEDGSGMVNDALIWGGSYLADGGGVVFKRETNATSISDHSRWQYAETHLGEKGYMLQEGVNVRADVIVNGSPGAVGADQQRGLRYPQWAFTLTWFAHDVPKIAGVSDHLRPGYLSTISLAVFGPIGVPLVQLLPLRSMLISFPNLDQTGKGYVQFDGQFGLQPDDSKKLWRYLLKNRNRVSNIVTGVVDGGSTSAQYGDIGFFVPSPVPNGGATVFTIPFGYIGGTSVMYRNGLAQVIGDVYFETDPANGVFTFSSAPLVTDELRVTVRTLSA
jgi:hypothetical protein